ncbi:MULTISPECIES: cytochrome bd oxidase small subunit CydS [Priestia]
MNTFLIMIAPVLLVVGAIVFLFIWGAKGKSPYQ